MSKKFRLFITGILFLSGICCFAFLNIISGQNLNRADNVARKEITVTRWKDALGRKPISYLDWKNRVGEKRPFFIEFKEESSKLKRSVNGPKVCVIVNSSLYNNILPYLHQYVQDLTGEGYEVEINTSSGGTPEELRTFLQERYYSGMQGCVLIGDFPVPWFEAVCWDAYEEFPVDLFYMDLDGVFTDSDQNGLYDEHTGDVSPEIWLGRLTPSPMTLDGADEVSLLQNYFRKNHLYRSGLLPLNNRGLAYIDDDWVPWSAWWNLNVGESYNTRTFVNDEWTTWDTDYESRLPQNYEFIQVCVHSSSFTHYFHRPDNWSYTHNWEIKAIDPLAYFYNLFACSNSRYVEQDNMGGWYIFCQDYGLASVGSTKTGSMLVFEDFYGPFAHGKTIGEAFFDWFSSQASDGIEDWELCWYYGMTLQGDPTLKIQKKSNSRLLQYDDGNARSSINLPDPSEKDLYNVRFTAVEECTLTAVTIEASFPPTVKARLYIWESDGTYPSNLIDSVDIPQDTMHYLETIVLNLSEKNITFQPNENFHIGLTVVESAPEEELWLYMDDGYPSSSEYRSCLYSGGSWHTLYDELEDEYNFTIRAMTRHQPEPEVEITTLYLPEGEVGKTYSEILMATGGLSPYSWELTAGNLPYGLSLNPSTGEISGVPLMADSFNFSVQITDNGYPPLTDFQHLCMKVKSKVPVPVLREPADSFRVYDITPAFIWTNTAGTGGKYTLEYDTDSLFPAHIVFDELTDTSFTLPDSLSLSYLTYYWHVQAIDESLNSSGYQHHPYSFSVSMRGDANGDKSVTISDVIYLINYLFKGGPAPVPAPIVGDVNCDGQVTVADVVYLINYLFKGGPPPGDPDDNGIPDC